MTSRRPAARWLLPSLVLVLLLPPGVAAQTPPPPASPEEVVREIFAVTQRADWVAYAKLLHPRAATELKSAFGEILSIDTSGGAGKAFFGVANRAEFDALSEAAVFEGLMKAVIARVPEMAQALEGMNGVILGAVPEGSDFVHVLYRASLRLNGVELDEVKVVSLERFGNDWRVVLPAQFAAFPRLVKAALEKKAAAEP